MTTVTTDPAAARLFSKQDMPSAACDTVATGVVAVLSARNPGVSWRWIMGSDAVEQSFDWKEFDRLRRMAPPLVVERNGHPLSDESVEPGGELIATAGYALPDISSTLLRDRLADGPDATASLTGLVPKNVLRYIVRHGLYQGTRDGDAQD